MLNIFIVPLVLLCFADVHVTDREEQAGDQWIILYWKNINPKKKVVYVEESSSESSEEEEIVVRGKKGKKYQKAKSMNYKPWS